MFTLRTHLSICGGLLAALILVAAGGNLLPAPTPPPRGPTAAFFVVFGLFLAFGASTVPVMVMTTLRGRRRPIDRKAALAARPDRGEIIIMLVLWALMAAGAAVAIPAMLNDEDLWSPSPGTGSVKTIR